MPGKQEDKTRNNDARISDSTRAGTSHERRKADPDGKDMTDAQQVWNDAETTPAGDGGARIATGGRGRVADAGDVGEGQPSPYSTEAQADAIARQTDRKRKNRTTSKS
jgi:hypothetical protein